MTIDKKTMIRRLSVGLGAVLVLAAVGFVFTQAGPMAPVKVTVAEAREGQFAPTLFGIGAVEARRSYALGPLQAARVRTVQVDAGEAVRAGQLLAQLDPVDLDERVAALDASLNRADSLIAQAQAQRADAQARRKTAQANASRNEDLARQNFISASALEARVQELASAEAQVAAALAAEAAARQDLGRLRAERAAVLQQRKNLQLLAPVDGVVISREAEQGATVLAGQPVVRMLDPASLWIRTRFDQARSAGLAVGLPAQVQLRSSPGQTWNGRVARLEAVSDTLTEERLATITLDAPPHGWSVGETAEVSLQLPPIPASLLVPAAALRQVDGHSGVWLVDEGRLVFRPVRKGASSPQGMVQVLDGLKPGERVVVYSQKALDAGSRFRVVDRLVEPTP